MPVRQENDSQRQISKKKYGATLWGWVFLGIYSHCSKYSTCNSTTSCNNDNYLKLYAIIKRMVSDCDPYVAQVAADHIEKLGNSSNSEPVSKKTRQEPENGMEQLLNDIELSLQHIHPKEILQFSDDEDANFADCY